MSKEKKPRRGLKATRKLARRIAAHLVFEEAIAPKFGRASEIENIILEVLENRLSEFQEGKREVELEIWKANNE